MENSLHELYDLQINLRQACLTFSPPQYLRFINEPKGAYASDLNDISYLSVNRGHYKLSEHGGNHSFIEFENTLLAFFLQVDSIEAHNDQDVTNTKGKIVVRIQDEWGRLDTFKESEWMRQQEKSTQDSWNVADNTVNTGEPISQLDMPVTN